MSGGGDSLFAAGSESASWAVHHGLQRLWKLDGKGGLWSLPSSSDSSGSGHSSSSGSGSDFSAHSLLNPCSPPNASAGSFLNLICSFENLPSASATASSSIRRKGNRSDEQRHFLWSGFRLRAENSDLLLFRNGSVLQVNCSGQGSDPSNINRLFLSSQAQGSASGPMVAVARRG